MKQLLILAIATLVFCTSCEVKPQKITFGKDACHYCKMNIVDKQHAAEIVSDKGKIFKYDAAECMLKDTTNNAAQKVAFYMVMDYLQPGEMIDAKTATFLVSPNIPSPMGAFLSAFSSLDAATKLKQEKSGHLYSWDEIVKHINTHSVKL